MNRPIEYRAFDLKNKKWLHEELEDLALNEDEFKGLMYCDMEGLAVLHDGTICLLDECGKYEYLDPERFILVQFIGLTDKNGVKIFEGDIVRWLGNQKGKVEFYQDGFIVRGQPGFWYSREGKEFSWSELEIIGNIFENPELLEGK